MTDAQPGALIAHGRSADIFEYGEGKVLRRRRRPGPIPAHEPIVMRAVRAAGYPAPEVFGVDGPDMVLERVVGVDMIADLERHPWRARRYGRLLAELHLQLSAIAPDRAVFERGAVPVAFGRPDVFVHRDLHPANVILTEHGPVVIDWERSGLGPGDTDVAETWLLMQIAEPDDLSWWMRSIVGFIRRQLLGGFLAGVPRPSRDTVRSVCQSRLDDPNMRPVERDRIRRHMELHG